MEFKSNLSAAINIFLKSLAGVVLALFLYISPINSVPIYALNLLAQGTGILIFLSFLYAQGWYQGDRDRIISERIKEDPCKNRGLAIGALVSIPYFAWSIVLVLMKIGLLPDLLWLYLLTNSQFNIFHALLFGGMTIDKASWIAVSVSSVIPIIIIITIDLSYKLGIKGKTLKEIVVYKNEK